MGHITTATANRLGYNRKYQGSWAIKKYYYKRFLHKDYNITRFGQALFRKYTTPAFDRENLRNPDPRNPERKEFSGEKNIIKNVLVENTFTFSHLDMARGLNLVLRFFFMDALMEEDRVKNQKIFRQKASRVFRPMLLKHRSRAPINILHYKGKTKLHRRRYKKKRSRIRLITRLTSKYNKYVRRFRKRLILKFRRKKRISRREYKIFYKPYRNIYTLRKIYYKNAKKPKKRSGPLKKYLKDYYETLDRDEENEYVRPRLRKKYGEDEEWLQATLTTLKTSQLLKKKMKYYPLYMLTFLLKYRSRVKLPPSRKKFLLLKSIILGFRWIVQNTIKIRTFFVTMFLHLCLSLFILPLFIPKFSLIRSMNLLLIKETAKADVASYSFKRIIHSRYLLFHNLHYALVNTIREFDKTKVIYTQFFGMYTKNITSTLITNYICHKLEQYFRIQQIIGPIMSNLKKNRSFLGFRLIIAGRLTRKERAAFLVRKNKRVTLGSKDAIIDYHSNVQGLRFGLVGIKCWLMRRSILLRPFNYQLSFGTKFTSFIIAIPTGKEKDRLNQIVITESFFQRTAGMPDFLKNLPKFKLKGLPRETSTKPSVIDNINPLEPDKKLIPEIYESKIQNFLFTHYFRQLRWGRIPIEKPTKLEEKVLLQQLLREIYDIMLENHVQYLLTKLNKKYICPEHFDAYHHYIYLLKNPYRKEKFAITRILLFHRTLTQRTPKSDKAEIEKQQQLKKKCLRVIEANLDPKKFQNFEKHINTISKLFNQVILKEENLMLYLQMTFNKKFIPQLKKNYEIWYKNYKKTQKNKNPKNTPKTEDLKVGGVNLTETVKI